MKIKVRQATSEGYISMVNNGLCDLSYPHSKVRRGRVQGDGEICPAITAVDGIIVRISIYEKTT